MKILIVEDDDQFRKWLSTLLKEAGYQAFESHDGRHALEWIQKNPIDLLITDILMPQVDGLEVLLEVKKKFPDLPSITMSEGVISMEFCVKVTTAAGSKKFLPKPFTPEALFSAIREMVDKKGNVLS